MNELLEQPAPERLPDLRTARPKRALTGLILVVLHVALVVALYPSLGLSAMLVTPWTAAFAGWFMGWVPGVLFALAATAFNVGLLGVMGDVAVVWSIAAWPGGVLGPVTGLVAGILSDLLCNIRAQARELALRRDTLEAQIREKEKAEEALRDSESALREIFHGINDGVVLAAVTGELQHVNNKLLEMYGYSEAQVSGKTLADFCVGVQPEQLSAIFEQVRRNQPVLFECESRRHDGTRFDIELHARKLRLKNEDTVVVTIHDISERKRAEDQLKESYRQMQAAQSHLVQAGKMVAVGQLATGIAHEINNPLAVILSSSEIMHNSMPPEWLEQHPLVIKHLHRIDENVQRCKSITQALLQFARNEKDTAEKVEVRSLIVEALRFVRSSQNSASRQLTFVEHLVTGSRSFQVSESSAVLSAVPNIDPLIVHGNARQLQQVIMNLMLNAIDATQKGDSVTLTLSRTESAVQIEVADTGPGIPREHLDRLFEPFFTTKPLGKGTGLGLYLCHSIVLAHHGSIEVKTKAGHGTTFCVRLPFGEPRPAAIQKA